ncbi:hypothetical protein [Ideonella sp.]|uniref:hypothetical protein n=1 Tax=Ideonella sp. TaxID=1929293 RepID=UPI002B49D2A7|nr:hypothetical protein [Ideonella sp.]HJV70270.1 hypothetical protein [Ideonella sp.]
MSSILRRALLGISLTVMAVSAVIAAQPVGQRLAVAPTITRSKYGMAADTYLPKVNVVTVLPFDVVRFEESADISLTADGMMQVNVDGLYYIHLGLDWKGQAQTDIDTRMYGIRRKAAGDPTPPNLKDERLASFDHPGSESPQIARYQGEWSPGVVPYRGTVATDVVVAPSNIVRIGDLAQASLSSVTDKNLGVARNTALQIQARIVAADTVRVVFYNPTINAGIAIPTGTLNVLAQSATLHRGDSSDAWNVLSTPLTQLNAGDKIYIVGKNQGVANDYVQASPYSTFVQFERFIGAAP